MAAIPLLPWNPKDDVLLKNAVEAGASLESLAKGAVQFSRQFTVQELQDRWYSLLYDPVVSEHAAAQMIGLENCELASQSKITMPGCFKETACTSGKRTAESVQRCYSAMRKRICSEPVNMTDVNLLSGTSKTTSGIGKETPITNCLIGTPISDHGGMQGLDHDIRKHLFSGFPTCAAETTGCDFTPSFTPGPFPGEGLHKNNVCNFTFPCEENASFPVDNSRFDLLNESAVFNLFEDESLSNGCASPEFGGTAFHSFGNALSLTEMPNWDNSAVDLLIRSGERDQTGGDQLMLPLAGNVNDTEAFGCADVHSKSSIHIPMSSDSMEFLTPRTDDYLAELFDFSNEELSMDINGKDTLDKSYFSGLNSLLLDSPNHNEILNAGLGEAVIAAEGDLVGTSGLHLGGSDNRGFDYCSATGVPSPGFTVQVLGAEFRNAVICCTLNTEDPEVPDNDDVFLPYRFPSPPNPSQAHWRLHGTNHMVPLSVKNSSRTRKDDRGPGVINTNQDNSRALSQVRTLSKPPQMSSNSQMTERKVKFDLPKSSTNHAAPKSTRDSECPVRTTPENVSSNNFIGKSPGSCLEKPACCPDISQNNQERACGSRKEVSARPESLTNGSSNAVSRKRSIDPQEIDRSLPLVPENLSFENEFDVPYFSDVEAMILDMELNPDEFNLHAHPEVQKYRHEETKRTIIRLEQAADACMQRTMEAKGAFAVVYSRSLKHFVTKPEVLLGRATEEVKVDIDLGREKKGGKISRRQALIMIDMNGCFHMKNLGKCPIYVNNKEVASGQSLTLKSGYLLEIRGLTFVFETNHAQVKRYVDNMKKKSFIESEDFNSGNKEAR